VPSLNEKERYAKAVFEKISESPAEKAASKLGSVTANLCENRAKATCRASVEHFKECVVLVKLGLFESLLCKSDVA